MPDSRINLCPFGATCTNGVSCVRALTPERHLHALKNPTTHQLDLRPPSCFEKRPIMEYRGFRGTMEYSFGSDKPEFFGIIIGAPIQYSSDKIEGLRGVFEYAVNIYIRYLDEVHNATHL